MRTGPQYWLALHPVVNSASATAEKGLFPLAQAQLVFVLAMRISWMQLSSISTSEVLPGKQRAVANELAAFPAFPAASRTYHLLLCEALLLAYLGRLLSAPTAVASLHGNWPLPDASRRLPGAVQVHLLYPDLRDPGSAMWTGLGGDHPVT